MRLTPWNLPRGQDSRFENIAWGHGNKMKLPALLFEGADWSMRRCPLAVDTPFEREVSGWESMTGKRRRRKFTDEFKVQTVRRFPLVGEMRPGSTELSMKTGGWNSVRWQPWHWLRLARLGMLWRSWNRLAFTR